MCYVATHPEKLDATKEQQWQKLANLTHEDMTTITNLELIGVPVRKRGKTTGLNFGRKRKRAVRKVLSSAYKQFESSEPEHNLAYAFLCRTCDVRNQIRNLSLNMC